MPKITAIHGLELEICVNMCRKPKKNSSSQDQHLRMRKIRIAKGTPVRNTHVCYKRERFSDILPSFCVIIFAYVISVSLGVRDSRNDRSTICAVFARQKNYAYMSVAKKGQKII